MAREHTYDVAKDIVYNLDERPQPVRVLVIAPLADAYEIERHFRSLIRPDLHLIEDNGIRFVFRDGGSVVIIGRSTATKAELYTEGTKAL